MDSGIPNKDEREKLKKIYSYHRKTDIYMLFMLYPALFLILITYFLDKYPVLLFAIVMFAVIMLSGIIYLIIKRELLKKCPRCSTRIVLPNTYRSKKRNCPRCGMYLERPEDKPVKRRSTLIC